MEDLEKGVADGLDSFADQRIAPADLLRAHSADEAAAVDDEVRGIEDFSSPQRVGVENPDSIMQRVRDTRG